ncbi:MAG TPA: polyribonucleotide nucleotidyltransferase, partial [Alphaproteobacteria bacterium]|nr:polyribonucleotide nucleotidyltransferase [Alphaproteobacteria bacterium]
MFDVFRKEIEWGGRKLVLESGRFARQADGAVLATYGDTTVLCTAVAAKSAKPGVDFFPLTVNYQEKTFAAGKIPGGFFKREGRPSEKEVLTSRLIDRPIRPLFAEGFRNETQVICTTLSHDLENDPDIVAMIGASAALTLSGIPFLGPIGAARVGYIGGEYVLNPQMDEMANSRLDLVVAGTVEGVLMVESQAQELTEDVMLGAVQFGHRSFQPIIRAIVELAEQCAKEPWSLPVEHEQLGALKDRLKAVAGEVLTAAYGVIGKQERHARIDEVKSSALPRLVEEGFDPDLAAAEFKELEREVVRGAILKSGRRIDGRDTRTVRPISCEIGVLPRTHGSALF